MKCFCLCKWRQMFPCFVYCCLHITYTSCLLRTSNKPIFYFRMYNLVLCVQFAGISVSVSTFNLVAISLERYSAICNPFTSRTWQTKSHAAKVITATWVVSFLLMLPYPIGSTLVPFMRSDNSTGNMCRLVWPRDVMQTW